VTAGARAWQRAYCGCCTLPRAPLPSARRKAPRRAAHKRGWACCWPRCGPCWVCSVARGSWRRAAAAGPRRANLSSEQRARQGRVCEARQERPPSEQMHRERTSPLSGGQQRGPGAGGARLLSARWRQAAAASAPRKRLRPLLLAPARVRAGHAAGCRARPCARWRTRDLPASARAQPLARCSLLCLCSGQAQTGTPLPATQQGPSAPAAPCAVRAAAQAELPAAGCFLWPTGACQGGRALPR